MQNLFERIARCASAAFPEFSHRTDDREPSSAFLPGTTRCVLFDEFRPRSNWGEALVYEPEKPEFTLPLGRQRCAKLPDGSLAFIRWKHDGSYAYEPVQGVLEKDKDNDLSERLLVFGVSLPGWTPRNLDNGPFQSAYARAAIQKLEQAGHRDVLTDIARREAFLEEERRLEPMRRAERERLAREETMRQKKTDALQQILPLFAEIRQQTALYDRQRPISFATDKRTSNLIFLSLVMADAAGLSSEEVQFLTGKTLDELKGYMRPNESWKVLEEDQRGEQR